MGSLNEPVSLCLNIKQHFTYLHTVFLRSKQIKVRYTIKPTSFIVYGWNMKEQEVRPKCLNKPKISHNAKLR